jgi:hypothetical protein
VGVGVRGRWLACDSGGDQVVPVFHDSRPPRIPATSAKVQMLGTPVPGRRTTWRGQEVQGEGLVVGGG